MKNKKTWAIVIIIVVIIIWLAVKMFSKKSALATKTAGGGSGGSGSSKTTDKLQGFPIAEGDKSNEVKLMQAGLNGRYNVYNGPLAEDGIYGPKTRQALIDAGFGVLVDQDSYFRIIGAAYTAQTLNNAL